MTVVTADGHGVGGDGGAVRGRTLSRTGGVTRTGGRTAGLTDRTRSAVSRSCPICYQATRGGHAIDGPPAGTLRFMRNQRGNSDAMEALVNDFTPH